MFTLKYTSSLPELKKYLDEQLKKYIQRKSLDEEHAFRVKHHYDEERRLLIEHVYGSPQKLKEMCFMAFLGHLAKEKKIKVSNVVTQCPFILYLLGVVSYDVFDEDYYRIELYSKGKINSTNYYVSEKFYETCKEDIKQFLDQSGYICMWEGKAPVCSDSALDREPAGVVVFPVENNLSMHVDKFGKLYDGTDCILEENSLDLYPQGQFYQFLSMKQEWWELSEEESKIIEAYTNQEVDKSTVIKILASGMINSGYESCLHYYDYAELYIAIGKERIDLFSHVRYLPSCWSVLEKFYRLIEQRDNGKVIAVDFDGTLSLGEWPNIGPANEELISFLKEQKKNGDKIILWTCREGEALNEAVEWCEREGLEFDAVNDNIPEMIERYGTNSRKVSCDYYIDDRAVWTNAFGLLR